MDWLRKIEELPPKRLALLVMEMKARLDKAERLDPAIAVVGMGCRIPGGANTPDAYWNLLNEGRDAVTEVPPGRWDVDGLFDADPDAAGKIASRWGGFVDAPEQFDAQFFGISRREAVSLDPQQRMALETAWEALENAGVAPDSLRGAPVGVFLGLCGADYHQMLLRRGPEAIDAYLATGTAHSVAAGRIAYALGLQGPNVAVDTACSSSLVAIHLACQSLMLKECRMALAGGANMVLSPEIMMALSRSHMMAPDGRCKAFDARADGFVRGEGCGMVVLKRLADAQEAGDRILAVIRGSAMNQDGRSSGITAPNGAAQEAVIRAAMERAGVAPEEIGYVETHGTGTALGDPIEAHALAAALRPGRTAENPLVIGSVKTNIGHLEAAAGVVGLMKVALSLEHERIPAHLHFRSMNPHIDWGGLPLEIPVAGKEWKRGARPRLAGVSSFGFSGVNVHLVVQEAPGQARPQTAARPYEILALSARTAVALEQTVARYATHLAARPETAIADLCYTVNTGRARMAERTAFVAASGALTGALEARRPVARGRADGPPKLAFVFSGQGTHYAGMGAQLYESEPVFRAAIDECDGWLAEELRPGIREVLYGGAQALLDETRYAQPALFALQWALLQLWRSWGVEPSLVLGHSAGEYAAACAAGVFSAEDGLRLIAARGRLMGSVPGGQGAMAAIMAPAEQVRAAVEKLGPRIVISAWNGPENVVVSGAPDAVEAVQAQFAAAHFRTERLRVHLAAHSAQMGAIEEGLEAAAARVRFTTPRLMAVSTLTGKLAQGAEMATAGYWRRQLRAPVAFQAAMEAAAHEGCGGFIEIGPGSTLLGMGRQCLAAQEADLLWAPSIRRSKPDAEQMAEGLAAAFVSGAPVNWQGYYSGRQANRIALPTYPFERQRYWLETPRRACKPKTAGFRHPFLSGRLDSAATIYEGRLDAAGHAFLAGHRVGGRALVPASVWLDLALEAAAQTQGRAGSELADFRIHQPAPLGEAALEIQVAVSAQGLEIAGREEGAADWTLYASARLEPAATATGEEAAQWGGEELDPGEFYQALEDQGIAIAAGCRAIRKMSHSGGALAAEVEWAGEAADGFRAHPALLDGCLQALGAAAWRAAPAGKTLLLAGIGRFCCPAPVALQTVRAVARVQASGEGYEGELRVYGVAGQLLAWAEGVQLRPAALPVGAPEDWFYGVDWVPAKVAAAEERAASLLPTQEALAAARELGARLCREEGLAEYARLRPELDRLVSLLAARALEARGCVFAPGAWLDAAGLRARLGVAARHERLLARLLEMLVEDGVVEAAGEGWRVLRAPDSDAWSAMAEALHARFPAFSRELDLTVRCGTQLAQALAGEIDPVQLLFPNGSFDELEALYGDSPAARAANPVLRTLLEAACQARGKGTLRVLEIGGGTGGTTAFALPALGGGNVEYVFTDVSPAFLARARERFERYGFVRYRALDIGADPEAQGFSAAEPFDVVIAANVLHATADVRQTLGHVRKLLAPGGVALILEGVQRERWVDLTFGLTEGWWKFTDTALRPQHPLLTAGAWVEALAGCGFLSPDVVQVGESQQALLVAGRAAEQGKRWLVVEGGDADATPLANALARQGCGCEIAAQGSDELRRQWAGAAFAGVIHAHGLCAAPEGCGEAACEGLLQIVRAMAERPQPGAKLWVVTRGAQMVAGAADVAPAQASLWGVGRTLALEAPGEWGGLFDLDPGASAETNAGHLLAWLNQAGDEDQAAVRDGQFYTARLARRAAPAASQYPYRADAAYLITGGLGSLGLELARHMVRRGARRLILAGRTGLPARGQWDQNQDARTRARIAAVREIEQMGAQVQVAALDVADAAAVASLVAETRDYPLAGVAHAAAVFDSTLAAEMSAETLGQVLRAKAAGAWALHTATLGMPLDFFVMYSSTTGLVGSRGMSHYGAANQFLDALAQYRRKLGLPALAVQWGTWDNQEGVSEADRERYRRSGNLPMDSARALDALDRLLAAGTAEAMVARIDWNAFRSTYEARRRRPFLERTQAPETARAAAPEAADDRRLRLDRVPGPKRLEYALAAVKAEVAAVMSLAPEEVKPLTGLFEMGMDSLMSVELKRRLEQRTGLQLPFTLTFNYPNASALAGYLLEQLAPGKPGGANGAVKAAPQPAAVPNDLTEDEMVGRLTEALRSLD